MKIGHYLGMFLVLWGCNDATGFCHFGECEMLSNIRNTVHQGVKTMAQQVFGKGRSREVQNSSAQQNGSGSGGCSGELCNRPHIGQHNVDYNTGPQVTQGHFVREPTHSSYEMQGGGGYNVGHHRQGAHGFGQQGGLGYGQQGGHGFGYQGGHGYGHGHGHRGQHGRGGGHRDQQNYGQGYDQVQTGNGAYSSQNDLQTDQTSYGHAQQYNNFNNGQLPPNQGEVPQPFPTLAPHRVNPNNPFLMPTTPVPPYHINPENPFFNGATTPKTSVQPVIATTPKSVEGTTKFDVNTFDFSFLNKPTDAPSPATSNTPSSDGVKFNGETTTILTDMEIDIRGIFDSPCKEGHTLHGGKCRKLV